MDALLGNLFNSLGRFLIFTNRKLYILTNIARQGEEVDVDKLKGHSNAYCKQCTWCKRWRAPEDFFTSSSKCCTKCQPLVGLGAPVPQEFLVRVRMFGISKGQTISELMVEAVTGHINKLPPGVNAPHTVPNNHLSVRIDPDLLHRVNEFRKSYSETLEDVVQEALEGHLMACAMTGQPLPENKYGMTLHRSKAPEGWKPISGGDPDKVWAELVEAMNKLQDFNRAVRLSGQSEDVPKVEGMGENLSKPPSSYETVDAVDLKVCTRCEESKTIDRFGIDGHRRRGVCKDCRAAAERLNKEKRKGVLITEPAPVPTVEYGVEETSEVAFDPFAEVPNDPFILERVKSKIQTEWSER